MLATLAGLQLFWDAETAYELARGAGIAIGLALALGFLYEMRQGLKNVFRIDVICLTGLYGLTLLEFLLPQPDFNNKVSLIQVEKGLELVYLGFSGLVIGRHLLKSNANVNSGGLQLPSLSPLLLTLICLGAFFLGNLFMFLAVNFNPFDWIYHLTGPRFGAPWGRGRYGNLSALLNELNLITYVIPPIAGMALAQRRTFPKSQFWTIMVLYFLMLLIAFAGGTRYILAVHLATFSISHIFSLTKIKFRYLGAFSFVILGVFLFCAYHMLEFRNMGLRRYLETGGYAAETTRDTLFIDLNMVSISLLADRFPGEYRYLGWEVPMWALIKPIPRALWPGKPLGLSMDIEDALGGRGYTIAATFIGEAYMAAGKIGVLLAGLFFGVLAAWWNRMAAGSASTLSLLVYASGFFGGVICMRSMFWLTTGLLPSVALIVFGKFIYPHLAKS